MNLLMKSTVFLILVIACMPIAAYAQVDKAKALEKGKAGVALVDNGDIAGGLKLLQEAAALDPNNIAYPYEIGYAYTAQKDYKNALLYFQKVIQSPEANDRAYAMLGNTYDDSGDTARAMKTYRLGLKKFPASGYLNMEVGNMHYKNKDYGAALDGYEAGIRAEPGFPSNYYRAAMLYLHSTEKAWGMIYGEAFMNLERNTERTATMSKELYDAYRKAIEITSDTSMSVSFTKNVIDAANVVKDKNGKIILPFAGAVYEPLILMSVLSVKTLDMETLCGMRASFLNLYFEQKHNEDYPNALLDYQRRVQEAGHLAAYNHWVLMKGDETAFEDWQSQHRNEWEAFNTWFRDHPLVLDAARHLVRN